MEKVDSMEVKEVDNTHNANENVHVLESDSDFLHEDHSHSSHEDTFSEEEIDFHKYSKKELLHAIEELQKESNFKKIDAILKQIKPVFDEQREKERLEALDKFIKDGGEADSFHFKGDELTNKFDKVYTQLKERKNNYFHQAEKDKEKNLHLKNELLNKLRQFVDSEETTESNEAIRQIQKDWKAIGSVPTSYNRNLWASYHALLDRFYNNRSIYFELKELDRKKNYEAKLEIVEKAEKLDEKTSLTEAIKELNDLHEEYRNIGPVLKEQQEGLWQKFKAASDKVYAKRKVFIESRKKEEDENLVKKKEIVDSLKQFEEFDSDRINAWNDKTKEILEIQKKWEALGPVPKEKAKEVNKAFWGGFKHFFHNKNIFFKKLEASREANLKQKQELCEQAEQLQDSEDYGNTAQKLKDLQAKWKTIGHVPEKFRDQIYERFKKACDVFFEHKRSSLKGNNKEQEENYDRKVKVCEALEQFAENSPEDIGILEKYQDDWNQIGFVPLNKKAAIEERFQKASDKFLDNLQNISEDDKEKIKIMLEVNALRNSPSGHKKLFKKEQMLRKKISEVESNISTWKNNIEFFANSKNANQLKDEFNEKIESASQELAHLKSQLSTLTKLS
ncbi:MAG TPA: DUF349 domain-containing protein [Cytophagales bacterium]|nr:DUF349 domain-containing protein [Cytophagales bacterium]